MKKNAEKLLTNNLKWDLKGDFDISWEIRLNKQNK